MHCILARASKNYYGAKSLMGPENGAIVTLPVIIHTDVVPVGPDRSEICRLVWMAESREECEHIILNTKNIECNQNNDIFCGNYGKIKVRSRFFSLDELRYTIASRG